MVEGLRNLPEGISFVGGVAVGGDLGGRLLSTVFPLPSLEHFAQTPILHDGIFLGGAGLIAAGLISRGALFYFNYRQNKARRN